MAASDKKHRPDIKVGKDAEEVCLSFASFSSFWSELFYAIQMNISRTRATSSPFRKCKYDVCDVKW